MGRPKKQVPPYVIPENILNNLNEHCKHGWMLFTYDDKDQFRLYCNTDNVLVMKSLRNDINNWLNAIQQLETHISINSLIGNNKNPNDDE
jgi:hypothetical protein